MLGMPDPGAACRLLIEATIVAQLVVSLRGALQPLTVAVAGPRLGECPVIFGTASCLPE